MSKWAIHNVDCLDFLRTLPSGSVDAVVTDPPFGVDYRGRWNSDWNPIANDKGLAWLGEWCEQLARIMVPNCFVVCFYGWPHAGAFLDAFRASGFKPASHLVFVKNQIGLGYHTRGKHEQAYLFTRGKVKANTVESDVLPWTRVRSAEHPTQKPLDAIVPCVERFCPKGATVLDPFAGSGTTGVACIQTGRNFIGCEIDAGYAEIARRRCREAEESVSLLTGAAQ